MTGNVNYVKSLFALVIVATPDSLLLLFREQSWKVKIRDLR